MVSQLTPYLASSVVLSVILSTPFITRVIIPPFLIIYYAYTNNCCESRLIPFALCNASIKFASLEPPLYELGFVYLSA